MRRIGILLCLMLLLSFAASVRGQLMSGLLPPPLPPGQEIEKGVQFHEVTLRRVGVPMKVWIYLPNPAPAEKLPCILIAPAGTRLFHGMELGEGDRPEHLPYVLKGFAVVSYEIDGPLSDAADENDLKDAINAFRKANSGVANAKAALDYVRVRVPTIDMTRIYAVGHSSAATLALQVGESDPRIAACVAFAPVCNVSEHLASLRSTLDRLVPGTLAFLDQHSPHRNIEKLTCPTMLFSAQDDSNVPTKLVTDFSIALQRTNRSVKLVTVKSGGHYESMIDEGIPAAIAWLNELKPTTAPPAKP